MIPDKPSRAALVHELEVHQIELKLQNEELRAARLETEAALERYTEIFDFAPIGYVVLATNGVIREANHAAARMLARERAALPGTRFAAALPLSARGELDRVLHEAMREDARSTCEVELDGPTPIELMLTVTMLSREDPVMLAALTDITEQRVREQELARTEAGLRDSERRKDDFLSALSHELRNPLGPIRNSLFVLSHGEDQPPRARDAYLVIDRQLAQLTRLVDDLLDATRIVRGKIQLRRERIDLSELARRSVDDHQSGFAAKGIRLELHAEPGTTIDADPARLTQVLSNLLSNAQKFTPTGGLVTVSVVRSGPTCELRVRDNGAGIDPAMLPQLFERFVQAPQTVDRSKGGLGLGLATVKGLIELHGGTVTIASEGAGLGSEVTIRLPAMRGRPWTVPMATLPRVASQRVLVIDDNIDGANSLKEALDLLQHDVRVAYSGQQGLDEARRFKPAVVICDIGLPDMDGYEVATAIRNDPEVARCYLVALSGYAQPSDVERATAAGFDRHLAKPASLKSLVDVVAHAL